MAAPTNLTSSRPFTMIRSVLVARATPRPKRLPSISPSKTSESAEPPRRCRKIRDQIFGHKEKQASTGSAACGILVIPRSQSRFLRDADQEFRGWRALGRAGHGDIAVDSSFDARAERVGIDEDDQVELEPLRPVRGQRPDAERRPERRVADDAGDSVGTARRARWRESNPAPKRHCVRREDQCCGSTSHVGVRKDGPDDRFGFRHHLFGSFGS